MNSGWQYRAASITGVALLTALAVVVVNSGRVQAWLAMMPVFSRLPPDPPDGAEYLIEVGLTIAVVTGALLPLYKPRPRRILDIVASAHKRILAAVFALATIGYFDYTYKLPRLTLVAATPILLVLLSAWLVWLRWPETNSQRAIIIGDDFEQITRVATETDLSLLGYLCPTPTLAVSGRENASNRESGPSIVSDGGYDPSIDRLGGLSRLESILIEHDVDTAVLAFAEADRAEFFGALNVCYDHGVAAKVHKEHADTVLTATATPGESLIDVEIEPWDIQDYVIKRAFDVVFAVSGLFVLIPVILVIAAAVRLEDGGPVLYEQSRTAVFGETFPVFKFRTMTPEGESVTPVEDAENDRITQVGRILRQTHLDEIPQLWSILRGYMSVVGPRAVWTEEEHVLEDKAQMWRKRWFVKPGLTGLAQINNASSVNPDVKLNYDLQYVREQSFIYDMKIVVRQIWMVLSDAIHVFRDHSSEDSDY